MIEQVEKHLQEASSRFLTFRVDAQLYALRTEEVSEVIRVPAVAHVPQAPAALLGLTNLRGSVLPVAGLRELLKKAPTQKGDSARAIVVNVGGSVALVVDSVEALETVDNGQIETRRKEVSADGAEKLLGAFPTGRNQEVAKILDLKTLLEGAFASRTRSEGRDRAVNLSTTTSSRESDKADGTERILLVTFDVTSQEFALPLDVVQEILPVPQAIAAVPHSEALVLGVIAVRDKLLPLLSLRGLLGFASKQSGDGREKVVVLNVGGTQIGLVVDLARAIVSAEIGNIEAIPQVLAARTGGESRIKSIYRGDEGRRLISILSPEQLFREDIMQRLADGLQTQNAGAASLESTKGEELIFLVFRLGADEFGLPIGAIVEVAQLPSQITKIPKAPKFLEGVVSLRGEVLPVVDQRRRFDMPPLKDAEGRRLVVVKTQHHRAGLIVDSVSDVLRIPASKMEPPPDLTDETTRLIRGVIKVEASERIVLALDPLELLTRAEQGLLDRFQSGTGKAGE